MRLFFGELLWLGAAGLLAWWFPITFLVIQMLAAAVTITLMQVERQFR
jgi:hypothetical protein